MTNLRTLEATLLALGPALSLAEHPWWILGSAAVALLGGDPGEVRDVDLLLDQRDCAAVFSHFGLPVEPGKADDRFRSAIFQRWDGALLPVELFAGFALHEGGDWQEFAPQTRVVVGLGVAQAFVPEREELIALLGRFGRAKDLRRIAALSQTGPSPSRSESA